MKYALLTLTFHWPSYQHVTRPMPKPAAPECRAYPVASFRTMPPELRP